MGIGVAEIVLGIPVTKSGNFIDYEKAIEWYVNVLGFELIWKMGIASLKLASGQEILLFGEEEDDENSMWYTGNVKQNPHYSIQLVTENIEELRSDLIKSGVFVGELFPPGGGGCKSMMFCDPYGNRFWAIENPLHDHDLTKELTSEEIVESGQVYLFGNDAVVLIVLKNGTNEKTAKNIATKYAKTLKEKYNDKKVNAHVFMDNKEIEHISIS
jgi:catechol 2,3-dioxygenase-like lactoylglutathione lyase family enzyme